MPSPNPADRRSAPVLWRSRATKIRQPRLLRSRLTRRKSEAVSAAEDCAAHNPDWKLRDTLLDIYLQMGMYGEAEKLGRQCRRHLKQRKTMDWQSGLARVYMLQRRMSKLISFELNFKGGIAESTDNNVRRMISAYQKLLQTYRNVDEMAFRQAKAKGSISTYVRTNYAWALAVAGDTVTAREQAALALKETEKAEHQATGMRLMHTCRRIRLLAILGREEEAREAIREAGEMHHCDVCEYARCKDLAIYEAQLEFLLGNYEKAGELARQGEQLWPDEADFIELEYLIRAKNKKEKK